MDVLAKLKEIFNLTHIFIRQTICLRIPKGYVSLILTATLVPNSKDRRIISLCSYLDHIISCARGKGGVYARPL